MRGCSARPRRRRHPVPVCVTTTAPEALKPQKTRRSISRRGVKKMRVAALPLLGASLQHMGIVGKPSATAVPFPPDPPCLPIRRSRQPPPHGLRLIIFVLPKNLDPQGCRSAGFSGTKVYKHHRCAHHLDHPQTRRPCNDARRQRIDCGHRFRRSRLTRFGVRAPVSPRPSSFAKPSPRLHRPETGAAGSASLKHNAPVMESK